MSTWLDAIKAGHYASWPGLMLNNTNKYCPSANKTILGHLVKGRQGVCSTRRRRRGARSPANPATMPAPTGVTSENQLSHQTSKELHIQVRHISKLYNDVTGRFLVQARSGNQYVMIAYHCDLNVILACPFNSSKGVHRLRAYNAIMERLKIRGHHIDLQVLDNEANVAYHQLITDKCKADFQLVPTNIQRRNAAKCAIRTFKARILAILAGVAPDYPRNLWDLLIPQTKITLNLLIQARPDHTKSAWEAFAGTLNYDATPLGPLGCEVISHKKTGTRNSWDFHGEPAWNIGVFIYYYRCQNIIAKGTRDTRVSDTLEFRHHHLTIPTRTPADHIIHGVEQLMTAINAASAVECDNQLAAIQALRQVFHRWLRPTEQLSPNPPPNLHQPNSTQSNPYILRRTRRIKKSSNPPPRVVPNTRQAEVFTPTPSPRVDMGVVDNEEPIAMHKHTHLHRQVMPVPPAGQEEPIARKTLSRIQRQANIVTSEMAAARRYPDAIFQYLALPVLDKETGKFLEYHHLQKDPKYAFIWNPYYANELGRLCQEFGKETKGPKKQIVKGTDTFRVMHYHDIPKHKIKYVCHTMVVCEYHPQK